MAIKALDIGKVYDFILPDDDPEDPTIWKIGTLSARDRGAIADTLTSFSLSDETIAHAQARQKGEEVPETENDEGGVETKIERSKMNWEAVRRGLKGWENFLDNEGEPIPFRLVTRDVGGGVKKSVVPNDLLDRIPYGVLSELAAEITKDAPTEADAGNSQEPSTGGSFTPTESAEPAQPETASYGGAEPQ